MAGLLDDLFDDLTKISDTSTTEDKTENGEETIAVDTHDDKEHEGSETVPQKTLHDSLFPCGDRWEQFKKEMGT